MKAVFKHLAALVCWLALAGSAAADTFVVLPFSNNSESANLDWLGESMSETIRGTLSAHGLLALAREDREEAYRRLSIRPYRPMTKASALRVAETLDADHVIFGSFELLPAEAQAKSRGTLRIKAHVIDLRRAAAEAEYSEAGMLEDLARLQSHLAWQTLRGVLPEGSAPSEDEFRQRTPEIRVDSIEHYTRGLLSKSTEMRLKLFSSAVRLDPRHSHAWFELGKLQWSRRDYKQAIASLSRVQPADAQYREAQFYLGISRYMTGDYAGAQQSFELIAASVPLNEVWNNMAAAQLRRNPTAAVETMRKALEGDPADPDYLFNLGLALLKSGKTEEAAQSFRKVLEREPDDVDAAELLDVAQGARSRRTAGLEGRARLKSTYEESAYLQLKAVLERKR